MTINKLRLKYLKIETIDNRKWKIFTDKDKDYEVRIIDNHPIFLDNKPIKGQEYKITWKKEEEHIPSNDKPMIYTFDYNDDVLSCVKVEIIPPQTPPTNIKKIKECQECQTRIKGRIDDCKDWEIKRKNWWTNLLSSKSECFCKKVENAFIQSELKPEFCSVCKTGNIQKRGSYGGEGEVSDFDAVVGCPSFDEHSPCEGCKNKSLCEDCKVKLDKPDESGYTFYTLTWSSINAKKIVCPKCVEKYKPKKQDKPEQPNKPIPPQNPNYPIPSSTQGGGNNNSLKKEEEPINYTPWLIGGLFALVFIIILALVAMSGRNRE